MEAQLEARFSRVPCDRWGYPLLKKPPDIPAPPVTEKSVPVTETNRKIDPLSTIEFALVTPSVSVTPDTSSAISSADLSPLPTIETPLVLPSLSVTADILSATSSADLPTLSVPSLVSDGMLLTPDAITTMNLIAPKPPESKPPDTSSDTSSPADAKTLLSEDAFPPLPKSPPSIQLRTPTLASKNTSSPSYRLVYTASSTTMPLSPKPFGRLNLIPTDQEGFHHFDRGPPILRAGETCGLAPVRALPRRRRPPDRTATPSPPPA